MKNLNEILTESLFDKDIISNNESDLVRSWVEMYIRDSYRDDVVPKFEVDDKKKTITISDYVVHVYGDKNNPFTSFIDYKLLDRDGKVMTTISFRGNIKGAKGFPSYITHVYYYADNKGNNTVNDQWCRDITKYAGPSLNNIDFLSSNRDSADGFKEVDLQNLNLKIDKTLGIHNLLDHAVVNFNPTTKINILQFGYDVLDRSVRIEHLPIFKTLSFKTGSFDSIKEFIENVDDKGKSNFSNIKISCKDLDENEKEAVKAMLAGTDAEFSGYGEILKKINKINSVINDKDGSKDRFGEPLTPGDIVIYCCSASGWPSRLDIYKGGTGGGRIRTETQSMVPPRNIIKLNNPKLLELLK